MRKATVLFKGEEAADIWQEKDGSFGFRYRDAWFADPLRPSIIFRMPKSQQEYRSEHLFAYFFSILPEGGFRKRLCRDLKIDEEDDFGLLLRLAVEDATGAITLKDVEDV
ncbi:HipA domain-containing protein [Saprospira grandis DSM 2844]|uniref:HipA domain-containing protein n=1 Tax=Saprospira grandis DSM 2844 TaxID=694433 RepID=J0XWG9_9BACT|nr:HipA N-terminal domain-containing protein [Saprospira grandis]EJF53381.1 HipA domain-containing protein [Saprospira grandis DSM 2844]